VTAIRDHAPADSVSLTGLFRPRISRDAVTGDGVPAGRLAGIDGGPGAHAEPDVLDLSPGPVRGRLVIDGVPLAELATGTTLRIGADAVVELAGPPPGADPRAAAPGLVEAAVEALPRPARVRHAGRIRVGDPVVIDSVPVPVEDVLDLHPFRPAEVAEVVRDYVGQAAAAGLAEVRLIHGRGRGVQRETVRRVLATLGVVAAFADAPPERGSWGATLVSLRPARPGNAPK
jgi:hypothetical protein